MPRQMTGTIAKKRDPKTGKERLYAVVRWRDGTGKTHAVWQRAKNRTHAKELNAAKIRELNERGEESLKRARHTFNDLADYYKEEHLHEAKYVNGRKISGRRDLRTPLAHLQLLRAEFGLRPIRSITYGDILRYKNKRLMTPTIYGRERTPASVHRELALLRNMLSVAYREGWILNNPFNAGPPLIETSIERKRERILTLEEEERLLAACSERTSTYKRGGRELTMKDNRRLHLRAIIICALDTAMRQNEIFNLRWKDVDLDNRTLRAVSYKGNHRTERLVPISNRLEAEIRKIRAKDGFRGEAEDRVFGVSTNVKRSFAGACEQAGIESKGIDGLTFHCLRHTAITRWLAGGMNGYGMDDREAKETTAITRWLARGMNPLSVAKLAGHAQLSTTYRYLHTEQSALDLAASISNALAEAMKRNKPE